MNPDPDETHDSSLYFACLLHLMRKYDDGTFTIIKDDNTFQDKEFIKAINNLNYKEGMIESVENLKWLFYCLIYYVNNNNFFKEKLLQRKIRIPNLS